MAVDDFTWLEFALQVRCDEVPTTHGQTATRCKGNQRAQRSGTHGGAKHLFEINAGYLSATLHTKPGFHSPVAFALVDPNETDKGPIGRDFGRIHKLPATVLNVIGNFGTLGCCPSGAIVAEGLLSSFRIRGANGSDKRAASIARIDIGVASARVVQSKQSGRSAIPQGVGYQTAPKVLP
eukprot:5083419-Pleurochrysis_carterae.AAC.1